MSEKPRYYTPQCAKPDPVRVGPTLPDAEAEVLAKQQTKLQRSTTSQIGDHNLPSKRAIFHNAYLLIDSEIFRLAHHASTVGGLNAGQTKQFALYVKTMEQMNGMEAEVFNDNLLDGLSDEELVALVRDTVARRGGKDDGK
jgi:hypothetical protein